MSASSLLPGRLVRRVIQINILVALVSWICYVTGQRDVLREIMPLEWTGVLAGQWWEFLTYMWIHAQFEGAGVLHIVCNMMTLAPFGRVVEVTLGPRAFAGIYLAGGLGGGVFFAIESALRHALGVLPADQNYGVVGASAAVLGVVAAFSRLQPEARLSLMFLPFRFRAGKFLLVFALVSGVLIFVPALSFVAHSAHLGGLFGGWAWMHWVIRFRGPPRLDPLLDHEESTEWLALAHEVEAITPEALRVELDVVLEKLNRLGIEQLGERDRLVLQRARKLFSV